VIAKRFARKPGDASLVVQRENGSTMRSAAFLVHVDHPGGVALFLYIQCSCTKKNFFAIYLRIALTNTLPRATISVWGTGEREVVQPGRGLGSSRFPSTEGLLHAVHEAR